jgi:hypothetical protein
LITRRYPLVLPPITEMTSKYHKILEEAKRRSDIFIIEPMKFDFLRISIREDANLHTEEMLKQMNVTGYELVDVDPLREVLPSIKMLWQRKGFKVCKQGCIALTLGNTKKVYTYPFVEIESVQAV